LVEVVGATVGATVGVGAVVGAVVGAAVAAVPVDPAPDELPVDGVGAAVVLGVGAAVAPAVGPAVWAGVVALDAPGVVALDVPGAVTATRALSPTTPTAAAIVAPRLIELSRRTSRSRSAEGLRGCRVIFRRPGSGCVDVIRLTRRPPAR
jgi:hypothetical protein